MDGAARDAIVAALRAEPVLVVAGDAVHRAVAADEARAGQQPVVEVRPPVGAEPWSGLAAVLAACRAHAPHLAPPAALEAAATGRAVGDHLGLAADLCNHLARIAEDGGCVVLVHDAHLSDLGSAAVVSHALAARPEGIRAVVTQDRTARGVRRVPARVFGDVAVGDEVATRALEPAEIDAMARRAAEAANAGAVLDAAAAAESMGDWAAAARWWLDGGCADRAQRSLRAAAPSAAAAAVAARLALRTASDRQRREVTEHAITLSAHDEPVLAVRLRAVEASARLSQGDVEGAVAILDQRVPGASDAGPAARVARELQGVVEGMVTLVTTGHAGTLLAGIERPLARLVAGGVDADAVQVLAAAAIPLGWHDRLGEARSLLDRIIDLLDARRHFVLLAHPLATSAWLARRRGRLELALTHGSRAIELAEACGWTGDARRATVEVAHVEALHGRLDDCRRHVASLLPPGAVPTGPAQLGAISALAVGELLADRPERAIELLEPVQEAFSVTVSPARTAWRHNLVEAYVRTGRTEAAESVLRDLIRWSGGATSSRERGLVSWCEAMLAPAGAYDSRFTRARDELASYPTLRWRAGLHHLRRMLADARGEEAAALADHLVAEASMAGMPGAAEHVREVQRRHGVDVVAVPSMAALSVEDLRVALALAEGAEPEDIATQLRLTSRRVEVVRERVLELLGIDDASHLAGFLQLDRSTPTRSSAIVRILGPMVVQRGEQQLVPPPGRPAALLALLAAEGDAPIDRVLDVLWPDAEPARARGRLRNVLARLRAAVGPVVERDGERLVLAAGVEVDARSFDRLVDDALRAPADQLLGRSERALAVWRGEPLPAWPYDDWALRERQRLVQRCVTLHVRRADALASTGAAGPVLDELEHALALQPDAVDLWERAVRLAEADERVGRARSLRRRAAEHDIRLG